MNMSTYYPIFSKLLGGRVLSAAFLMLVVSLLSIEHASAANRIFDLNIKNGTDVTQGFWLGGGSEGCYEGTGANSPGGYFLIPNLAPGESFAVQIARVQGNDCDGNQGHFTLQPYSYPKSNDVTNLEFDNAGNLAISADLPNRYHAVLSEKSLVNESYTWTMLPIEQRLKQPVDQRLTRPRNNVTTNSGEWAHIDATPSTLRQESLLFDSTGFWGNYYQECFGHPLFHPQHVQRLDDKDGKAYFMVTNTRAHNGNMYLVETFPGALDQSTGRVTPASPGGFVGKIIWEEVFTGSFNGTINPIGNWNHPGKMTVIDGVLIMAAQNWSESKPIDGCTNSTTNLYQLGDSEDAALFFDVRDPSAPEYWGKMTATELEVGESTQYNGPHLTHGNFLDRMISVVSLWRTAEGKYALNAGGRRGSDHYATWETDAISPNIDDWELRATPKGTLNNHEYTSGEYGDDFESYEATKLGDKYVLKSEVPLNVFFSMVDAGAGRGNNDGFQFSTIESEVNNPFEKILNLGFDDDDTWIASSHHATPKGIPLVYTVENRGGSNPVLYQVYDTRNTLELPNINRVVINRNDSGPGSLREAIGYGGTITFDDSLNGKTLILQNGPLVVSRYDVTIDATNLSQGFTISGGYRSRVLHVNKGNEVTLRGITIRRGYNKSEVLAPGVASNHSTLGGGGILNEGTLTISQSAVMSCISEKDGGGIFNAGTLEILNSTIAGNYSAAQIGNNGDIVGNGNTGGGGGISNAGNAALVHTTVAGNDDLGSASIGGITTVGDGLTIDNSIIAANSPSSKHNLSGRYTALGASIVNSDVSASLIGGSLPIVAPNLEAPSSG